ncbi:MAG: hypothetical protein QW524_00085 [Candidatus Woesearchaeota archaeon]
MKYGASTIVTEILLVAFVVAVGALIIGWSNSFIFSTKETADQTRTQIINCQAQVSFKIWMRNQISMVCYNETSKFVQVYLENTGRKIDRLYIRLSNLTNHLIVQEQNVELETGEVKRIIIDYSQLNDFSEIYIFPVLLMSDGSFKRCADVSISILKGKIEKCQNILFFNI